MFWLLLILGVVLWWGAHLFKRVAPARRTAIGDRARGAVALTLAAAIILMVIGYRGTDFIPVWQPPAFFVHINNLAMLIVLFLMSPAGKRGRVLAGLRHPMLTGFGLWAAAHLLVNGDLASILMFGGLLIWAVVTPQIINAAEPGWTPRTDGALVKDAMFLTGSVVLLGIIGYIHAWLGVWPFPT